MIDPAGTVVVISSRFRGPPDSGHGGYTAGVVARRVPGAARVTLRKPPPLDRPLGVETHGDVVVLTDGEDLVAEAQAAPPDSLVPPAPTGFEDAVASSADYPGFVAHPFPHCFGCGVRRDPGDGLRIFPGPVGDRSGVAGPWVPDQSFADEDGIVAPEIVWAALDCAGGWSFVVSEFADTALSVLGRLSASLSRPVRAGERYVVVGEPGAKEGRKRSAATGIFDEEGEPVAVSAQTWIELPS